MSSTPPNEPPAGPPGEPPAGQPPYQPPPGGYQQPPGGYQQPPGGPPSQMPYVPPGPDEVTQTDRIWAGLSYVFGLLAIIALVMDDTKNRKFIKYHAVHAIGLWVVFVAYFIIANILWAILFSIISLGFLWCFAWLIYLVPWVYGLYCAYQAFMGKYFSIPLLTDFLVGQKWVEKPNA